MANPTVTARSAPVGIALHDGFDGQYAFAADPDVSFWEKSTTPPGVDNGEPIDVTTSFNTSRRTKRPRHLAEATPGSARVAYDPVVRTQIDALIGVETSVTYHYPDGSTDCFYGYLKSFKPGALEDGQMPMADIEIVETDYDPVNHLEVAPVYADVAGT